MATRKMAAETEKSGASVAHSSPDFEVPRGACDCHVHVIGPKDRFPMDPERLYTPAYAPLEDLQRHLKVLHLDRVVIVSPSFYGFDCRSALYAIQQLGDRARGIAVVAEKVKQSELEELHRGGMRGARLNLETAGASNPKAVENMLRKFSETVAPLGWHVQIYTNLLMIDALRDVIPTLPTPVVFDHFAHLEAAKGLRQTGFPALLEMMKSGKAYVKLSAPYHNSELDGCDDVKPYVDAMISANPERVVWGSDWPHTFLTPGRKRTREGIEPLRQEDDGVALNRMARWLPEPEQLRKLLVDNPGKLYFF
jgi:predicted TIM-barrel fold metal-dependent hydrolase